MITMNNKKMMTAPPSAADSTDDVDKAHEMLEKEKQTNKLDSWNKIDKMMKMRKLNAYADRYGREHSLSVQELKSLKAFFLNCLDTSRLSKSKDVVYDRDTQEIKDLPSLVFHPVQRNFTLRILDVKRVSTLKALAPRRKKEEQQEQEQEQEQSQKQQEQEQSQQKDQDQDISCSASI